jgi:2-polyprenyl-3-methyl-5-hydroxy-6-metoxy-1,4-benzoquinol methylase
MPPALPGIEDVPCDVCGAHDVDVLREASGRRYSAEDLPSVFSASSDAPLTDRLVRCRACDLVYVSARVDARAIVAAYGAGDDVVFAGQSRAREMTFEASLTRIEKMTGAKGRLFDIGTATGSFLAVARQRGWSVDGCEPNAWLAAQGAQQYGVAIRTGTIDTLDLPLGHYDAVTMWDVVEHLPAPSAAIARAGALLAPGGFLFLTFPDIGSLSARVLGLRWPLLRAMHLYYFSRRVMRRVLSEAGFEVVAMEAHMPRLEAGYLLERAGNWLRLPGGAIAKLSYRAGLGQWHVPVRMGQAFVAARRVRG